MNEITEALQNFLDENGRLTAFPAKRKMKLYALVYLAGKFDSGTVYSEKQVGELLAGWHTFADPATLRRELYNHRFLSRDSYGKEYRTEKEQPTLAELFEKYGL